MILWDSFKVASPEDTVPLWSLRFLRNDFLYVLTDWISTCAPPKQNRQHPKHRLLHEMPAFLPKITPVIRSNPPLPKDDTTILLQKNVLIPKRWLSAEDLWCSLWWLAAFVWDQWCNCISSNPAIVICVATSPLVAASVSWTVAAAPVAAPECCVKWWKLGCGDPAMGVRVAHDFSPFLFVTLFENKCKFNMEAKWTWGWPLGKIIFKNLRFWGNYAYSMSAI